MVWQARNSPLTYIVRNTIERIQNERISQLDHNLKRGSTVRYWLCTIRSDHDIDAPLASWCPSYRVWLYAPESDWRYWTAIFKFSMSVELLLFWSRVGGPRRSCKFPRIFSSHDTSTCVNTHTLITIITRPISVTWGNGPGSRIFKDKMGRPVR